MRPTTSQPARPLDASQTAPLRPRRHHWLLTLLTLVAVTAITACGGSPKADPKPPVNPENGGLFLNGGGTANRLYLLDHVTGEAHELGAGLTEYFHSGGLAWGGDRSALLGTDFYDLYSMPVNGNQPTKLNTGPCSAEGLAMDIDADVLYQSVNGILQTVSPVDCETTAMLMRTGPDIEGLALDAENQLLYGIGRNDDRLLRLDLAAGEPYAWTAVGSTGAQWDQSGLAYDPALQVLYAVGHETDLAGLYTIDPLTAQTSLVGDTGLVAAVGGLAWIPLTNTAD